MKKAIKKLTPRDAVLGIGRDALNEELEEYLNRPRIEKFKPIRKVRKEITMDLCKRNHTTGFLNPYLTENPDRD